MERASEDHIDEEKASAMKEPLLVGNITSSNSSNGGLITLPFILANEGFERAASSGLEPNMILYLMRGYGLEMTSGSTIIFLWHAASSFTPVVGAFLADAFVGRFQMIAFGSILTLMGMVLLWSTTIVPGARPSCDNISTNTCTSPTPFQLVLLCSSFGLMSLGAGGIRSSTMAFGADQLVCVGEEGMTSSQGRVLESFFNWYYFSNTFASLFALTCVVYIQENMGWKVGFGVPLLLMFLSAISFFLASSFYVKAKPKASLLTAFAQVTVASWRNRHYKFHSPQSDERLYHVAKGSTLRNPTENLRFLNKACIMNDPLQELTVEGAAQNPWHLCTIDQVEELKSVLKIIPLWSTTIMFGVIMGQLSFAVLQANSMDRHILSSSFEIPAGSFGTFALLTVILWLVLYDRIIIPLASKAKGKPTSLDTKTRMGIGLLFSIASLVVAAVVEGVRRERAIAAGEIPDYSSSRMSALWLVPQFCLVGLSACMFLIAQLELYYSALPRTMSSISSNLCGLGLSVANLGASLIMSLIDHITTRGGQQSWISRDPNKGHYDYYYWVLAGLSLLNYMYFLLCSKAYWQTKKVSHEAKEISNE